METQQALTPEQRGQVREVVGVFDNLDKLQSAIDDLLTDGFDQTTISLLAPEKVVRQKLGDKQVLAEALEDNPAAPRGVYIDPEARNEAKAGLIGALIYIGAVGGAGMVMAAGSSGRARRNGSGSRCRMAACCSGRASGTTPRKKPPSASCSATADRTFTPTRPQPPDQTIQLHPL
jgi:hypothetical protein